MSRALIGASLAVVGSMALHLTGAIPFAWSTPPRIESGGDPTPARLGTSFADMIAGSSGASVPVPEPAEVVATAPPADRPELTQTAESVTPGAIADTQSETEAAELAEPLPTEAPDATSQAQRPTILDASAVNDTPRAETAPSATASAVLPYAARPNTVIDMSVGARPVGPSEPASPGDASAPAAPPQTAVVAVPIAAAAVATTETVVATAPEPQTPGPDTQRPVTRPDPNATPEPAAPAPVATGNANQNASAGAADGQEAASSESQAPAPAPTPPQPSASAAEISNYPGLVQRHLSRRGRLQRVNVSGIAYVTMVIGPSGALSSVYISTSSGDATLDQAALNYVSSASPFPPPPPGAENTFYIPVQGGR
ncbi:MAG: TonB family protein [Pseudomonadota bacterium]